MIPFFMVGKSNNTKLFNPLVNSIIPFNIEVIKLLVFIKDENIPKKIIIDDTLIRLIIILGISFVINDLISNLFLPNILALYLTLLINNKHIMKLIK